MSEILLGGRRVGVGLPVLIVAEVGNNHDGSFDQARRLIDAAADAHADAVKFQTHIANEEMLPCSPTPSHFAEPRYTFIKRIELDEEKHQALKAHADARDLLFFSTPSSIAAVDLLERIDVPCFKVGSGDVTDIVLLDHIARKGRPIILSTGMSSWNEIEHATALIKGYAVPLILMQCTSKYPCPYDEVGLALISELQMRFRVPVGLSDHTPTGYTAVASVALGACMIEKHFTLDKYLYGPDHKASLTPAEMARLIEGVRAVEAAMKPVNKDDITKFRDVRDTFQKSIVSAADIAEGVTVKRHLLTTKRPGTGIGAERIEEVVGRETYRFIPRNTMLRWKDLK